MADASFDLERFVTAQDPVWGDVLAELRDGRKQTHWMWFVFPQLAVLGRSSMARLYGLSGLEEARAYLAHPVLGRRLVECCRVLSQLQGGDPVAIFGEVDAMKLRSCLTLFAAAAPAEATFRDVLLQYFGGTPDPLTTAALG